MAIDDEGEGVQNALKFDDVIFGRTLANNTAQKTTVDRLTDDTALDIDLAFVALLRFCMQ
jgi:polysaccharide deacetylase 2 family uncharacterized protein YibQ